MDLSRVEVLACILIVFACLKLLFVLINLRAWLLFMKWLFSRPKVTSLVAVGLAAIVLYFLVESGLTIIQILAVCLFVSLLIVAGVAPYFSSLTNWFEGKGITQVLTEQWLYALTWFLLLAWGVYELVVK